MNAEFLQSLGITDEDPNIVLSKLGAKEIELLDRKDLAETNGNYDRVNEIEDILEQLKKEREAVKEDAKKYVPKKEETSSSEDAAKVQKERKNAAYEKLMAMKKAEAEAAQREALTNAANSGQSQNNPAPQNVPNRAPSGNNSTTNQTKTTSGSTNSSQSTKTTPNAPATGVSQKQNNVSGNNTAAPQATGGTGEYSTGLRYYQKQDYDNAFKCFLNAAEDKNPQDAAAIQGRIKASYLLSVMYRNGDGTNIDVDRSNHYLKRAADLGYDQAQLEYGELILSQHKSSSAEDVKARKTGWAYIEKAADAGLLDAAKKYIDLAKNSSDADKYIVTKAKYYIQKIKDKVDSYEAQKYDEWWKELDSIDKEERKEASYPVKFVIGEILFLIGTIYLFKGLNPVFFETTIPKINKFIPEIPDFLIIKWAKLLNMTEPYMTHQGIFGCWLILLGNLIRGLGVKVVMEGVNYDIFAFLIKVAIIVLCVLHFVANIIETKHFFGNGGVMQVLAMVVCIIVGRILGWIMYKIIK